MTLEDSATTPQQSLRGDIWRVEFDPTVGDEIKKTRRAIIISADDIASFKVKLVVPLTGWKLSHNTSFWCVPIEATIKNGLEKKSTADLLQTRCVSIRRFVNKTGYVAAEMIEEIVAALAALIEHES